MDSDRRAKQILPWIATENEICDHGRDTILKDNSQMNAVQGMNIFFSQNSQVGQERRVRDALYDSQYTIDGLRC